jgi:hypothetical protein
MKLIIAILLLAIGAFAQNASWKCEVTKKVVVGDNFKKIWDLQSNQYITNAKDTLELTNMSTGEITIMSFNPKVKTRNRCKQYAFQYDKTTNSCTGVISKEWVKQIMKGQVQVPENVLNMLLDTMSHEDLIDITTSRSSASEIIYFRNGYGERYLKSGEQKSFELEIVRDDDYYLEANNGIFTKSHIKLNKKNQAYEMTIDAPFLDAFVTITGTCTKLN